MVCSLPVLGLDLRGRAYRLSTSRQIVGQNPIHALDENPRAPVVRHQGPCPLNHYDQAIAETDQEQDVNEQPSQPGESEGDVPNCCGKMPSLRRAGLPASFNLPKQSRMSPSPTHKRDNPDNKPG